MDILLGLLSDYPVLKYIDAVKILRKGLLIFKLAFIKKHPLLQVLAITLFLVELKQGRKINKALVAYSIISALMMSRMIPDSLPLAPQPKL